MLEFEYWGEIQTEEVDRAFEAYLNGSYIQKIAPKERAAIFQIIEQSGLLGVAVEAHEKWEVLEYLKMGYSLEDIGNGKAYKEYKPRAHAAARYKELKLYQFWYTKLFGGNPPAMKAFLFVNPFLKIILEDVYKVKTTTKVMDYFVRELKEYENIVRGEESSEEDIIKCIRFFEQIGYDYGDQRAFFLNQGLTFLEEIR